MRIKRKNGLKVAAITIALLLCLALAVGITGAWYQAKRQATGTLSMDQGIIIDYKGFGQTPDEGIWTRETTTTFLLFDETNAQPGQNIPVNAAGIRANEKSVNFYARVKLSYKFYNNGTEVTTLPNASDLITTSANFFGTNWVDGGSSDGYYYYATGSTLNKLEKGTQTFVDLFATDAKFIIEGAGFTGADNNGESGGFKIDETTSINKIEVYLTLETLQGDVQTEELNTMGWKIEPPIVDFEKITNAGNGEVLTLNGTKVTDEKLNVTINDTTTSLETIQFPYGEETILEFDSKNVDYITLKYSNGETETFGAKAEDFANAYDENTKLKVTANSSKGKVTGYIVGRWSESEYTGLTYSKQSYKVINDMPSYYNVENGIAVTGYFGDYGDVTISGDQRVRSRDFKVVLDKYSNTDEFTQAFLTVMGSFNYPLTIKNTGVEYSSFEGFMTFLGEEINKEAFMETYPTMTFEFSALCQSSSLISGTVYTVKEIAPNTFSTGKEFFDESVGITSISLPNTLTNIGSNAFYCCRLKDISIPDSVVNIGDYAFAYCQLAETLNLGSGVQTIGEEAFRCLEKVNTIIIPNNVTSIGKSAFMECSELKSVTLGNNVSSIGRAAFASCHNLTSIIIPDSVITIGDYAFDGCSGLTSVTLGNSVTNIGERAFYYCNRLTSITIPSSVTSIAGNAFSDCSVLTTTIGEGWVKASDNTAVDPNTLLTDINYDIKRTA